MNLFKSFKGGFSVFAGSALALVAGSAAADDLSTGVVTAITGTNPQITAVVTAMAGALVLILAWTLIKKAMH